MSVKLVCGSAKFSIPADLARQELTLFGEGLDPGVKRYYVKSCRDLGLVEKFVQLVKGEITIDHHEMESLRSLFEEFGFSRFL